MLDLLAAALLAAAAPDTSAAAPDTSRSHRIVREFAPIEVTGSRASDIGAVETVHATSAPVLRRLAADRFTDAVGLMPGVVASGEDLHVRGGRAGELAVTVAGVPLNDPLRGGAFELPLFAVRQAELLTGALDADRAGALAGELAVQTEVPSRTPRARLRLISDEKLAGHYEAVQAAVSGPLPRTGWGVASAVQLHFDDMGLPNRRSTGDFGLLGARFPLANDNRAVGWIKLAPLDRPQRRSLELLASRVVRAPYDPMFTTNGWVTFYELAPFMTLTPEPVDAASYFYNAADHKTLTEQRRLAAIGSLTLGERVPVRLAAGWIRTSELVSVGLRHDPGYVNAANSPVFGPYDLPGVDAFHIYGGDEPYFRDAHGERWLARADAVGSPGRGQRLLAGGGLSWDRARLYELDMARPITFGVDPLRRYDAGAPGGFAYTQHRWQAGGFIANAGLRLQAFTPGSSVPSAKPTWSLSPRLGLAYPVSVRDAFSFAYARISQDPGRDYLYESRARGYDRRPLGNGAIGPAEVVLWQAALKHVLDPEWTTQFSVFMRDVWGTPGVRNAPGSTRPQLQYQGADDAHATGFEVELTREGRGGQRLHVAYTFMNAWGAASQPEGIAYGAAFGARPLPTGNHPLDWDIEHALGLDGLLLPLPGLAVSFGTRIATGRPWTPLYRTADTASTWPPLYANQADVNSKRLGWSESTRLDVRWAHPLLMGAEVMVSVDNLFDNRAEALVSVSGYPNPIINTLYDEYAAYRTETGRSGGAYWDGDGGPRRWIPVNDPRLRQRAREIRLGISIGD